LPLFPRRCYPKPADSTSEWPYVRGWVSTANPIERAIQQELKRRTRKIRVFPNEAALQRRATAILVEIDEEWIATDRAYITMTNRDG